MKALKSSASAADEGLRSFRAIHPQCFALWLYRSPGSTSSSAIFGASITAPFNVPPRSLGDSGIRSRCSTRVSRRFVLDNHGTAGTLKAAAFNIAGVGHWVPKGRGRAVRPTSFRAVATLLCGFRRRIVVFLHDVPPQQFHEPDALDDGVGSDERQHDDRAPDTCEGTRYQQ